MLPLSSCEWKQVIYHNMQGCCRNSSQEYKQMSRNPLEPGIRESWQNSCHLCMSFAVLYFFAFSLMVECLPQCLLSVSAATYSHLQRLTLSERSFKGFVVQLWSVFHAASHNWGFLMDTWPENQGRIFRDREGGGMADISQRMCHKWKPWTVQH